MNKYSLKIYKFIDKINKKLKFNFHNLLNPSDPFIIRITNCINEVLDQQINQQIYYKVKNIDVLTTITNDPEYPLIYIFLKEYIQKRLKENRKIYLPNPEYFNSNDLSFESFLKFYLDNSTVIDYNKIHNDIIADPVADKFLIDLYIKIFDQKGSRKKLHDILYDNPFVGLDITHYAETTELQYINIESEFFNVDLFVDATFLQTINIQILKIVTVLTIMKNIATVFNLDRNQNKINLRMILSKQKKSLYSNYDILGPINVNSGSTNLHGEFINIWRFEEFEKVMIHEIQHYYGCDFHSSNTNYFLVKNVINEYFDIKGDDKVNESYNEVMAHIISMIYFSKIYKLKLEDVFHSELYFLLFQTAKIIDFFGGNEYNSILKTTPNHIKFNQRTSVLSYYLIKTLFMFYISYTTKFIEKINMKCNDKKSMETLSKFIQIIIDDTQIQKYINPLIKMIKKNKSNKFIYKTMRMTGIE